jgi:uncharacterized protein YbbC (DUF1343 family)
MTVGVGLDVWVRERFAALKGRRVGAIVNPTSVDGRFRHLIDLMSETPGVRLTQLFGPEHGIRGEAQYMVAVGDVPKDRRSGIPVRSLYGSTFESLSPPQETLSSLDTLVFDIQDVGCRYYTYIYTMALSMRAAAKAKIAFVVLDRPNPLGLERTEGNLVGERFRSFVGLYGLPNRHGMTVGEVARLINDTEGFGADLSVVSCEGLTRAQDWKDTGRAFIPPSPNMPTVDTAYVYPGMCLLEGTNLSEGRGTCRPFEQFGAPYLKAEEVASTLNALELAGVVFRPCSFTPTFDKFRGVSCEGAFIHVTDKATFCPYRTGIAVVQTCRALGGSSFGWRVDAYEFVDTIPAFDLLCGTDEIRLGIEADWPFERLCAGFESPRPSFEALRARHALYA